ncbi:MAG TPA: hypothetical protein VKU60_12135 [Chloroflexota bacterium]|nr:hypothetical protein [Chloroflexota bacterium]
MTARTPEALRALAFMAVCAILGGWFQGLTQWRFAWGEVAGAVAGLGLYWYERRSRRERALDQSPADDNASETA